MQILLHAQHVSGNTMPIIRSSRVLYRWSLPVVFGALVFGLSVWCGAEGYVSGTTGSDHLYNTLELLMMGIVLPETCWACNKICNKYLLHLVGILFPYKFIWMINTELTNSPSSAFRSVFFLTAPSLLWKWVPHTVRSSSSASHWADFHEIWFSRLLGEIRRENSSFSKIWQE